MQQSQRSGLGWRYCLLALCALGLIEIALRIFGMLHQADLGLRTQPTAAPFVHRIVVDPAGAAAASGLRTGDLVDTRRLSVEARLQFEYGTPVGSRVTFPAERDGHWRTVTIVADRPRTINWDTWLYLASQVWIVLFCALLAWRRPQSREARMLGLFLLCAVVLGQSDVLTPWPYFNHGMHAFNTVVLWGSFAFLVSYAELFGRPISRLRRVLGWLAYGGIVVTLAIYLTQIAGIASGHADPFVAIPVRRALLLVLCLLPLFAAIVESRGPERTRVTWATVALAPVCLWAAVTDVFPALTPARDVVTNVGFFIIPAVLTYSLLNRRLIDIEFVVNRAAIYTVVSLVLVGTFILVEWLLTDWLREASHATNVIFTAGLTLSLGLSMRYVHTRVDRTIDEVFFRKRHEDEQAIRTFAYEAPYITDKSILLERAIEVLERHTDASFVEILLDDGRGHYGRVSENDPAIVRLRATHKMVDLHGLDSALRGDLAFPMVARGHLNGALVLGSRRSGEAYAPDESSAIAHLALSLGAAIEVLSHNKDRAEEIVAAIEALREEVLRRLPPAEQGDAVTGV